MNLPTFRWVHQNLYSYEMPDLSEAVAARASAILPTLPTGAEIAVTAGSRGIANIPHILRAVCEAVRQAGGYPFLVPAMGSHGGATASRQVSLLAGLGITEESVGAPIRASMEVVNLGKTSQGVDVFLDRIAAKSDGIVVVERIKPHTDYEGPYESGLAKMLAIGLGKERGAATIHRLGARGLREIIPQAAEVILRKAPIIAGVAVMENAVGGTADVVPLKPGEIMAREPELLAEVKSHSPRLPFAKADLLITDYIGKDVSGTGFDTKVIGRIRIQGEPEPEQPAINHIVALDLSSASHGNANGIGLADATTQRLVAKIDHEALRVNAAACGFWERAKVPVAFADDRAAIEALARFAGQGAVKARIARIRDTLHLDRLVVSEALLEDLTGDIEIGKSCYLSFDSAGNLTDHETFPG